MSEINRQFQAGTTRTSAGNTAVTITTGAFSAFEGNSYSGGINIFFTGGTRSTLAIPGITLVGSKGGTTIFSHTITTSPQDGPTGAPLTFSGGNTIVSGTIVTYHNLAQVAGASSFNNVAFSASCCYPVSGSITTTFSSISGHTPLLPKFVGASETLTYTGCGTAIYSGPEGYNGPVTMGHCI